MGCKTPGMKIRSKGKGRGLGTGKGKGPLRKKKKYESVEMAMTELDEAADELYFGFLYEDSDLEELNVLLAEADVVSITKAKRKKIAKEYSKVAHKKAGPGSGKFAALVKGGMSPALAAYIGRKKYGKKKMDKWSAAGKKRMEKRKKKVA